ncbi:MAG: L-lactate permease [Oscillospiraceae bacterium]|nr:L-lactate permease [Oscillospiraceae bacterium]
MTILALIPIICLFICLVGVKLSVAKSGLVSLIIALIIAFVFYGFTPFGLAVAAGKACWLALFVSLIVWCALLLYHLVSDFGAIEVINKNVAILVKDEFAAFLLLGWCFTGLLQGIAGFGIPSVIVAPILISLGFSPVKSLAAPLIGHSWSVTFGSMGAAFFVIHGITDIPEVELALPMWMFNAVTILGTGIGLCFVYNGFKGIKKGISYVLPVAAAMSGAQFLAVTFGMYSIASIITGLAGATTMFLLYKLRYKSGKTAAVSEKSEESETIEKGDKPKLNLLQAVLPYALILVLLLSFQFIPKSVRDGVALAPSFPETSTTLEVGHTAASETNYNPIRLLVHPALVLLIAALAACIIYKKAGIFSGKTFGSAAKKTVKKGIPATLALLAFGNMSLVMMDSGQMFQLAQTVANLTGKFYPLVSPYIGVLATFLTGNNTNSNVMFGDFQYTVARELGMSGAVMSAAQSIAGGLGCSIASTLIFMAALTTNQPEKVPVILKKLIPITCIIAGGMGLLNFILLGVFQYGA